MKDTTQTQDNRSSREIQNDIREVRGDMDQTLDTLNDRLSPRALINGLMEWFDHRESSGSDMSRRPKQLARFVRDNPVPALLTGIGVAWLIAESQSDDDEPDFDRFRVDRDPDYDSMATGFRRDAGAPGEYSRQPGLAMSPLPSSGFDASDDEGKGVTDKLKDKIGEASDAIGSAVSSTRENIAAQGERAKKSAGRMSGKIQHGYANAEVRFKEAVDDYPLGIGAGFVGLGLLAGLLLPRSEAEDEWFGESADDIKDAITDKGEDLLERGKEVAGRVADEAIEEAERQGLTTDSAASALESVGDKIGSVVEAAKEEGKKAAQDEHLTPEDLKSEARSEAARAKDRATEQVGS